VLVDLVENPQALDLYSIDITAFDFRTAALTGRKTD